MNLVETERFLAYLDSPETDTDAQDWNIKPLDISSMWDYVLDEDWFYMFDERDELAPFFLTLKQHLRDHLVDLTTILNVTLTVRYASVEGVETFGNHIGSGPQSVFRVSNVEGKITAIEAFVVEMSISPLEVAV